jgi:hypothetical protein
LVSTEALLISTPQHSYMQTEEIMVSWVAGRRQHPEEAVVVQVAIQVTVVGLDTRSPLQLQFTQVVQVGQVAVQQKVAVDPVAPVAAVSVGGLHSLQVLMVLEAAAEVEPEVQVAPVAVA